MLYNLHDFSKSIKKRPILIIENRNCFYSRLARYWAINQFAEADGKSVRNEVRFHGWPLLGGFIDATALAIGHQPDPTTTAAAVARLPSPIHWTRIELNSIYYLTARVPRERTPRLPPSFFRFPLLRSSSFNYLQFSELVRWLRYGGGR